MTNHVLRLACLAALLPAAAWAQTAASDEALIRATVNTYFEGWSTGDTTKLSSAMHPSCHLKFVRDGAFGQVNKNTYLRGFKPQPRGEVQTRILQLHHTGHAAGVVSEIRVGGNRYTDYFNLLRINGRWYITDKAAIREEAPLTAR
ncbi:nuclear transport factor 2 family protein [Solirubrum puertoriconensis]|uniref:Nuclear transport factor 2 family protein n=1 Tax=Solirubrum puertoriconensis TaxID=1751427 RepID=A0A9X0L605_SOLP1|nr:nuclear transport factor 2 family protein [Solirubrum puertoriconensis]KUG09169.1 hypothetical protein ASU33_20360 [Solirubrum puertoriconensis]